MIQNNHVATKPLYTVSTDVVSFSYYTSHAGYNPRALFLNYLEIPDS